MGPVSVKTKSIFRDRILEEIELIDHFNGLGSAGENVIPEIIRKQSLKVDTISGATGSSMTIIKSIEKSLQDK